MWIFSVGFYSIVQDVDDPAVLVCRARVASDLDQLRVVVPELSPTVRTPLRDYPYRARATRDALARGVSELILRCDYSNYKASIAARQGWPREQLYAQVWSVMLNAEEKLAADNPCRVPAPFIAPPRRKRSTKTRRPR